MTEPPTEFRPGPSALVAMAIGAVVGIVAVMWAVGLGPTEILVILLPMVVVAAFSVGGFLWAKRHGHLD